MIRAGLHTGKKYLQRRTDLSKGRLKRSIESPIIRIIKVEELNTEQRRSMWEPSKRRLENYRQTSILFLKLSRTCTFYSEIENLHLYSRTPNENLLKVSRRIWVVKDDIYRCVFTETKWNLLETCLLSPKEHYCLSYLLSRRIPFILVLH